MTKEEIKSSISMREVLSRYGISVNSKGQCRCPFHNDQHASMQAYKGDKGYFCFACGEGGDIFRFVMKMENCSFNEALKKLGGDVDSAEAKAWRSKKEKRDRELAEIDKKLRKIRDDYYSAHRELLEIEDKLKVTIPTSDKWVALVNQTTVLQNRMNNLDVDEEELLEKRKTIETFS